MAGGARNSVLTLADIWNVCLRALAGFCYPSRAVRALYSAHCGAAYCATTKTPYSSQQDPCLQVKIDDSHVSISLWRTSVGMPAPLLDRFGIVLAMADPGFEDLEQHAMSIQRKLASQHGFDLALTSSVSTRSIWPRWALLARWIVAEGSADAVRDRDASHFENLRRLGEPVSTSTRPADAPRMIGLPSSQDPQSRRWATCLNAAKSGGVA